VCHQQGGELPRPLITTWPVIAEAAWLLRKTHGGVSALLGMISEGLIECYPLDARAAAWMDAFLKKYADQDPQLADVSLMYVADIENITSIFTLDRRDFSIYRLTNKSAIQILPTP
jgi:hypothetical protein